MSLDGQRLDPDRYAVIPRTISFVVRQNEVLLIKLASNREGWSDRYNGIGGHIEAGEDPLTAVMREVEEETGLSTSQALCGVVMIDVGDSPGIGLFVFVGEALTGKLSTGPEGTPTWIPLDQLDDYKLVDDLSFLLPQALQAYSEKSVFSAVYTYDSKGKLQIGLAQ